MSLFDILEDRMTEIFESGNLQVPFPFKKLAKQTLLEMRHHVTKMDGRQVAPSLYTILVNPQDDNVIAPLYQQVTDELVDFLAHEAQNHGYALPGAPMVRFIADPSMKPGKMAVIAEVVTADVLALLHEEEAAYARSRMGLAGRGMRHPRGQMPQQAAPQPAPQPAPRPRRAPGAGFAPNADPAGLSSSGSSACELKDRSSGRTWRIGVPSTVIGREEGSADLVLPDTNVSRRHAELTHDAMGWHIADLGSTNGLRVNNNRVQSADLHTGDIVSMGLISLSFREL